MKDKNMIKLEIQNDIREMSELISLLSVKYSKENLIGELQQKFLGLSARVGMALDVQMQ
ncbi:MAG: hypothetical protein MUC95_06735 [Spirochaetes bacterium]|jgi:hypothetical protein|nr:hypothetical protein [Spirochaetota bacterium]